MKIINQQYIIKAPIGEVWRALTNPAYINAWGGGPAKINENIGAEFSLRNGEIFGKNIEVVENEKLVQEWYVGDWQQPSYVRFGLVRDGEAVLLEIIHEDIPDEAWEEISDRWQSDYIGPLKKYLENKKI